MVWGDSDMVSRHSLRQPYPGTTHTLAVRQAVLGLETLTQVYTEAGRVYVPLLRVQPRRIVVGRRRGSKPDG
jgi:hypothetical protein